MVNIPQTGVHYNDIWIKSFKFIQDGFHVLVEAARHKVISENGVLLYKLANLSVPGSVRHLSWRFHQKLSSAQKLVTKKYMFALCSEFDIVKVSTVALTHQTHQVFVDGALDRISQNDQRLVLQQRPNIFIVVFSHFWEREGKTEKIIYRLSFLMAAVLTSAPNLAAPSRANWLVTYWQASSYTAGVTLFCFGALFPLKKVSLSDKSMCSLLVNCAVSSSWLRTLSVCEFSRKRKRLSENETIALKLVCFGGKR